MIDGIGQKQPINKNIQPKKAVKSGPAQPIQQKEDSFTVTNNEHFKAVTLNSASLEVFNTKGLEKNKYNFSVKSTVHAPDGSLYVAYADYSNKKGNYISAVGPDGKVKWEASAGEEGIRSLKAGPDGAAYVRTNDSLISFNPDGKVRFKYTFEEDVNEHSIDKKGNNFFKKSGGSGFIAIDPKGNPIHLPVEWNGLSAREMTPAGDGTAWCKSRKEALQIDMKTGKKIKSFQLEKDEKKTTWSIDRFQPTDDGGIIMIKQRSIAVPSSRTYYDDMHVGLGFGRRFHPHIPPVGEHHYMNDYNIDYFAHKYDKDGNVEWKSGTLGSELKSDFNSKGRLLAADKYPKDGKVDINRIGPKGKTRFATVEGTIRDFKIRRSDDHLFVQHGDRLTEFNNSGKALKTVEMTGNLKNKVIREFEEQGTVILRDYGSKNIYRWNPENGDFKPLTDHKRDYSFKTAKFRIDCSEKDRKPTGGVEVQEKFIVVDGVKIPINS